MRTSFLILLFISSVYAQIITSSDQVACDPIVSAPAPEATELSELLNFQRSCNNMQPGESRIFNNSNKTIGNNGLRANYKLTRSSEDPNHYIAAFNPIFYFHEAHGNGSKKVAAGSQRDQAYTQMMIERVNECLAEINGSLNGPFGQSLEIKLEKSNQSSNPPPGIRINVYDYPIERENTETWSTQTSCPIIVHEIFHYLGLADSYEEEHMGYYFDHNGRITNAQTPDFRSMYDCRAVAPQDSVMHFPNYAYDRIRYSMESLYNRDFTNDVEASSYSVDMVNNAYRNLEEKLGSYNNQSIRGRINFMRMNGQLDQIDSQSQNELVRIEEELSQLSQRLSNSSMKPAKIMIYGSNNNQGASQEERFEYFQALNAQVNDLYSQFQEISQRTNLINSSDSSLLYPAEFMNIISTRSCYLTESFEQCSRNAYSTSYASSLGNYNSYELCAEVPAVCQDGSDQWLMLD